MLFGSPNRSVNNCAQEYYRIVVKICLVRLLILRDSILRLCCVSRVLRVCHEWKKTERNKMVVCRTV